MRPIRSLKTLAYISGVVLQACASAPTDTETAKRTTTPVLAGGSRAYAQVAAGFVHTCAIASDGAAFCWGGNEYSQLGSDAAADACGGRPCSKTPVPVSGDLRFTSVAAGWVHNCGISVDKSVYCWGGGADGELGDGSRAFRYVPVAVSGNHRFSAIAVGLHHSCGIATSGRLFCWGSNNSDQLGTTASETCTDAASPYQCSSIPILVSGGQLFEGVSAGGFHTCAIARGGGAFCWGQNDRGQIGNGVTGGMVARPSPVPEPVIPVS